jgi:lysophospholipase L1-like esterase
MRVISIVIGGAISVIAIFADKLGFGMPGSFGIGQFLLLLIGLILVLVGSFGKKFINLYRATAIIILNTILLFACLELGAIILSRLHLFPSYRENVLAGYPTIPYYASQEWGRFYWQEAKSAENYQYKPYVLWSHLSFVGETININQQGIRQTPGSDCNTEASKVFIFGGSTMWGWGSPDWGTIASYIQKGMESRAKKAVCVVNFGEDAFVSTQSLIELMRQLQSGNIPDLVIFYDGVNEVIAAYESGQPGDHLTLSEIESKLEEREHPLVQWIRSTRLYSLLGRIVQNRKNGGFKTGQDLLVNKTSESSQSNLADLIGEIYLNNYRIVGALAQEYGFKYFFFWQPHLVIGEKAMTEDEQSLRSELNTAIVNLVKSTYGKISIAASNHKNLWYIANVFDNQTEQIWIDTWGHVTPQGNRLVAREILAAIKNHSGN